MLDAGLEATWLGLGVGAAVSPVTTSAGAGLAVTRGAEVRAAAGLYVGRGDRLRRGVGLGVGLFVATGGGVVTTGLGGGVVGVTGGRVTKGSAEADGEELGAATGGVSAIADAPNASTGSATSTADATRARSRTEDMTPMLRVVAGGP